MERGSAQHEGRFACTRGAVRLYAGRGSPVRGARFGRMSGMEEEYRMFTAEERPDLWERCTPTSAEEAATSARAP